MFELSIRNLLNQSLSVTVGLNDSGSLTSVTLGARRESKITVSEIPDTIRRNLRYMVSHRFIDVRIVELPKKSKSKTRSKSNDVHSEVEGNTSTDSDKSTG